MNIWRKMPKKSLFLILVVAVFLAGCGSNVGSTVTIPTSLPALPTETIQKPTPTPEQNFDGQRALLDVATQLDFGPRYPGTHGHKQIKLWIQESLQEAGWQVVLVEGVYQDVVIQNIAATKGDFDPSLPWVMFGAHFDTRKYADKDPDPSLRTKPVPGANDGASGVAVLLELARTLPENLDANVSLVFFDAEDTGGIEGWDWIIGSQIYVESLTEYPDRFILVDMVGDADQNFLIEQSSDFLLAEQIWDTARRLEIDAFIFEQRGPIIDDHTPFLQKGISAVDIIDFDYLYWHTTHDTLDKVSAESLQNVGDVLIEWLRENYGL